MSNYILWTPALRHSGSPWVLSADTPEKAVQGMIQQIPVPHQLSLADDDVFVVEISDPSRWWRFRVTFIAATVQCTGSFTGHPEGQPTPPTVIE